MTDHYQLQCDQWAKRISTIHRDRLRKKLPELHGKDHILTLWHFDRQIAIDLETGLLHCISDPKPLSLNEKLNIYTLLWYCKDHATLSGQWLPFHSMKDASPYAPAFEKTVLRSFSHSFDGKEDLLKKAVQKIGGTVMQNNAYFVLAFACMPLRLQFWDGDEEFPAQGNILFDKNATDFIYVESLVTIASQCLHRLYSAVDLHTSGDNY